MFQKIKSEDERVAIYIDGNNFFKSLRSKAVDFPKGDRFDYSKLAAFLAHGRKVIAKRYYIGIVRNTDHTAKSAELVKSQQKFLSGLENEGFTIKRGRIVYDGRIREKGVDVKIAVDLIIGAVDNLYDTAIIVSSDTDLIPAVKYVKYKEKKVEYVGFSNAPSLGMQKFADESILLRQEDMQTFKQATLFSRSG